MKRTMAGHVLLTVAQSRRACWQSYRLQKRLAERMEEEVDEREREGEEKREEDVGWSRRGDVWHDATVVGSGAQVHPVRG